MRTDIRHHDNSFSELEKLWTLDAVSCPLALRLKTLGSKIA